MFRDGAERVLVFRLGAERFAVRLAAVDEVVDAPPIQPLPDAAANVLGIVSLRGDLVSVFDPRPSLNVSGSGASVLLLFVRDSRRIALAIDDVYDAMTVESGEVLAAPGSEASDGILAGVVRRGSELVSILDADALLDAAVVATEGERT